MRVFRVRDFEEALAIDAILFPETHQELPEAGNQFWLARDDEGQAVGFASVRPLREASDDSKWKETVFLSRVGVLQSARNQGLQTRFVRARLRWARRKGYKRAVTYVSWDNVWSLRVLVKAGFLPFRPTSYWAGNVTYLEREI